MSFRNWGALKDDLFGPKAPAELFGSLKGFKDFVGRFEGSVVLSLILGNGLPKPTRGRAGGLMADELPCFGRKFKALRSLFPPSLSR
jgi:hypothetical protein